MNFDPEINKYNSSYVSRRKNPFIKKNSNSNGKSYDCLIDTGAECSVLNKIVIAENTVICRDKTQLTSVLGEQLKTIGKVKNLEVKIDKNKVKRKQQLQKTNSNFVIIGADTIIKNKVIPKEIIYPKKK